MATERQRLDLLLVDRGLVENRTRAQALILAGRISTEGHRLDKPGMRYPVDLPIEVAEGRRYVGRGAHKLIGALEAFAVDPAGLEAIDVGSSTGGFTQVLLERGASRVIALDVGRGQLDWGLRQDPRVEVVEGVNARYLGTDQLKFTPSLAVVDVSFISLEKILPPVVDCLRPDPEIVVLVKPQFELARADVGKGGIVREPRLHQRAVRRICTMAQERGWGIAGIVASPLHGADGNREFFVHIRPGSEGLAPARLDEILASETGHRGDPGS